MPEIVSMALALPGLGWLIGIIIVAGVVRGFAGFGSAMIILPVASSVLDPVAALVFLAMTGWRYHGLLTPRLVLGTAPWAAS